MSFRDSSPQSGNLAFSSNLGICSRPALDSEVRMAQFYRGGPVIPQIATLPFLFATFISTEAMLRAPDNITWYGPETWMPDSLWSLW
ncbi:hypothetical protein N7540_000829 [Penicillium herquei]|nr:hypothetical protein N7540_000829 [Penicillium herquei]